MASASQRMIHQDYIARIRYSNALPPPPNPPKLLDIPNTGLSSGQYTTPGFASRLARDQPLNIEADAELGMPLDLVGMPGVFDGDESSIQAPLHTLAPHPHDRPLLRPLSTLGKPKVDSGVSFLRRTEYISSHVTKTRFEPAKSTDGVKNRPKKPQNVDRESPEYIKNEVEKSFEIATANLKDRNTEHPTNPRAELLNAYPLLPDLESFPDIGGYITIKFLTNPVSSSSTYDTRLESGILRPIEKSEEEEAARDRAKQAHLLDPTRNEAPEEGLDYEFYLTETPAEAWKFKRKFDTFDPEKDSDDLYTRRDDAGEGSFRFKHIRAYETAKQITFQHEKYDHDIVIATHDGSDGLRQKAVYYYPILQETSIRPQRTKNINRNKYAGQDVQQEDVTDMVDVKIEDPDEHLQSQRNVFRDHPYGKAEEPAADGET